MYKMEGIIYLTLLFIAVAFEIVVVYIAVVLKRVSDMMESMGATFAEVEKKTHVITPEIKQSLQETGKLIDDVEHKFKAATDDAAETIENTGTSVQAVNQLAKHTLQSSTDELNKNAKLIKNGLTWGVGAFQLYSQWKKINSEQTHEDAKKNDDRSEERRVGKERRREQKTE